MAGLDDLLRHAHSVQRPTGDIKGPGDGQSDHVPANGPGNRPILLANDEHINPADVVSLIGSGSSRAGHAELDRMHKMVRSLFGPKGGKQAKKFSWSELGRAMDGKK